MKTLENKMIHFVGIGGIGMSAIAENLWASGIRVQGSDIKRNATVQRLEEKGITVFIGHQEANVENADILVCSTATKKDNVECQKAYQMGIPVLHRSQMLAIIMREKKSIAIAGTHGKTTTSSMIADILCSAGKDPSFIIGGVLNKYKTNSKYGLGEYLVAEADESDGSFLNLPHSISVVNNIDMEHMDYYGTFQKVIEAYHDFAQNSSDLVVACSDHPVVQKIIPQLKPKVITYGLYSNADVKALNIRRENGKMLFDVCVDGKIYSNFSLLFAGRHNIQNSLAAIAVCRYLGVDMEIIKGALAGFEGVYRRFTYCGCQKGITVYDDYAHHPVEIKSTLKAGREVAENSKVIAVFQPHRYSRASDLADEFATSFADADVVIVCDIYPAGEVNTFGISSEILAQKIKDAGHSNVFVLKSESELVQIVRENASAGDIVLGLGAGNVTDFIHRLPAEL